EKLYEELLVKTEELDKTENSLIFIEKDKPLSQSDIALRLKKLEDACATGDNDIVKRVLKEVVPTYKDPKEINGEIDSEKVDINSKVEILI
ncbi:MAG: polysaccharide biosynthesis protein, partial [Clostridia bacterium]|nr:polysaccharide biosynthesis protein [Clostridia bacterium]